MFRRGTRGGDTYEKLSVRKMRDIHCAIHCPTQSRPCLVETIKINKKDKGRIGGAVGNLFSAVCALSIYSRLCMKMSSFLFVRACAMPRLLNLSCGIPFPV